MIYENISLAREDLSWLLNEPNVLSSYLGTINEQNLLERLNSLEEYDDKYIKSFYNKLFEERGFNSLVYNKTLEIEFLPLLGFSSNHGLFIVYEKLSDNSFAIQSKDGKKVINEFEKDTIFAPLVASKIDTEYTTSKQMFKTIASKHKKLLIYLGAATFSINTLALATSLYTMQVYDRVVPTGAISTLIALTLGVFIAMILEMVLKFSKSTIHDYGMKAMDVEYSNNIFSRFLKIRCDVLPKSVGTLSGQLQSYNSVRGFIVNAAIYLVIDLPFSIIFLVAIFVIGGFKMGLIPIIFFIVAFSIGMLFRKKIEEASRNSSMASYKKTGLMVESVEHYENIKASGAGYNIQNTWNSLTHSGIDDDIEIKHYHEMSTYFTQFLQQASYICIVSIGAYLVSEMGELTMGSLIAMTILSGRILQPIAQLPSHFVSWGKAKLSMGDLDRIYQLPVDNDNMKRPLTPYFDNKDLMCKDIEFGYNEKQNAIKISQLYIKQGEKVAILGVIGSGKSTLLKLLSGLYKPTKGFCYLNGIDMHLIRRDIISDNIGYLAQTNKLFSGTLRDNLVFGLTSITDEKILEAAKLTGLIHIINALPDGLDTPVPEGGESVSGGQKQLIALTRVVIANKDIWLLDEPTSSMDEGTERNIINMLKNKLLEKQTLVVVTHKPVVLNMVDRIIVMSPQGIAMNGPKDEVLAQLALNAKNQQKKVTNG